LQFQISDGCRIVGKPSTKNYKMKDKRQTIDYRRYQLVACGTENDAKCWAWRDGNAIFKASANSMDAAIQAIKIQIDQDIGELDTESKRMAVAFEDIFPSLSAAQVAMLQANYRAPERTITADELAKVAGFKNHNAANLQYGLVGKAIHELTRCELQKDGNGAVLMTSAIAIGLDKASEDGQFRWKLRDDVASALKALGIVAE
jgi:uncharacterized protein YPO0396